MKHLDDGILRRMGDEPFAIARAERLHYNQCSNCQERFEHITSDAEAVTALMAMPALTTDPHRALDRFHSATQKRSASNRPRSLRDLWPRRARRPVVGLVGVAALVAAVALTPAGSLAQDLITVFEPTQVTAVDVTTADLTRLSELQSYGTLKVPEGTGIHRVSDWQAAEAESHMQLARPTTLPDSVTASPQYDVQPASSASFTFDAAKASEAVARDGETVPQMPANIDGSTLSVSVNTAVVTTYRSAGADYPSLIVGQMDRPVVRSSGVSAKELEDYLLSLPSVSPQLAAEIRAIGDPTSTLPIPVPVDVAHSHSVQVQGVDGVAVGDNTGLGSGVVWQKDGVIYGVAGPLTEDQVLQIANSLQS